MGSNAPSWKYCTNCGIPIIEGTKFCPNCGKPIVVISGQPTKIVESKSNVMVVTKKPFSTLKKVLVAVFVILGIFLAIGYAVGTFVEIGHIGTLSNSTTPFASTASTTTTKQLAEMFPTREDVGTIWRISGTEAYNPSALGFVEGYSEKYTKVEGIEATVVNLRISKFNSSNYAKTYFDQVVSTLKEKGGYEEFLKGSDRYGEKVSYPSGEWSEIYYVKGQFYVDIKVTTGLGTETDKTANDFFNIILGKV